ncbi:MAG TPA: hypothetical protein VF170_11465 [Planctomycetaceae bacterium]
MTALATMLAGLPAAAEPADGLTPAGWVMMIVSLSAVLAGTAWCFYRILTLPPVETESLHGPPAIDTRDTLDAD